MVSILGRLPTFFPPTVGRGQERRSTRSKVTPPWITLSRHLMLYFHPPLNCSTYTARHWRAVRHCQLVNPCSTCWRFSKSGFESMLVSIVPCPRRHLNHPCARRGCAHVTNASVSYQCSAECVFAESLLGRSHRSADLGTCGTTSVRSKMPALSSIQRSTVRPQHKRLASSAGDPRLGLTVRSSRRRFANEFTVISKSAYHYRPNVIYSLGTH